MERTKKARLFRAILILITILTLAFIWGQSCLPDTASSKESGFLKELIDTLINSFNGNKLFELSEKILRKAAHFMEYAALGGEFCLLFATSKKIPSRNASKRKITFFYKNASKPALTALFVAMIDETIQYFVPGRFSSVLDVWLDCAGATFGVFLIFVFFRKLFKE